MSLPNELVTCETSTRSNGDMSFKNNNPSEIQRNRKIFLEQYGSTSASYVPMNCDHGTVITTVTHLDVPSETYDGTVYGVQAETLVTQEKGLTLFLLTADCIPLCFYDPITETIALSHISRVTFEKELIEKTVSYLRKTFEVEPEHLIVYIAPHIHKNSYTFTLPLTYTNPKLLPYMETRGDTVHIDLTLACTDALIHEGVLTQNITTSPIDTATSNNHFSYFNMKQISGHTSARMATVLMMK